MQRAMMMDNNMMMDDENNAMMGMMGEGGGAEWAAAKWEWPIKVLKNELNQSYQRKEQQT